MRLLRAACGATAAGLALPTVVLVAECAAGAWPGRTRPRRESPSSGPRVVVLVPAHDEARTISETVRGLQRQIGPRDRILVVADNCSDATASLARRAGADVVERVAPGHRGKGYALSYGLDHLAKAPPDVVVVFDADCSAERGAIRRIAEVAAQTGRPAQADYVLRPPADASTKARVSAFAVLLRNRVRLRGLSRLTGTCPLVGSGMAFPWGVIRDASAMGDELVEDLALGIDCALRGHAPLHCEDARVWSELPASEGAAIGQRRRWETGHLRLAIRRWPSLVAAGLRRGDMHLVALGLDLAVPPLTLLALGIGGAEVASIASGALLPAAALTMEAVACGAALTAAWWFEGRTTLPPRSAASIATYVAWKVPLYARFAARGAERSWVRTERAA